MSVKMTQESSDNTLYLVTLGLLVLDELFFASRPPVSNVIGGSGAYCALGARLFLPGTRSIKVGWMVLAGYHFPANVQQTLLEWNTSLHLIKNAESETTRGELRYSDDTFGPKEFRYLTKPMKVEPKHLQGTQLLSSMVFHLLTSPGETYEQTRELLSMRQNLGIAERPFFIWEPAPLSVFIGNLDPCLRAAQLVDVFSPNHIELATLFGVDMPNSSIHTKVEELAQRCLRSGIGLENDGTVVVRAGEVGCCLFCRERRELVWLPPFYEPDGPRVDAVVDPTGAGNAFLGGFSIGWLETKSDVKAACYGTVAASFALEQIGLPKRRNLEDDREMWNDVEVQERLVEYMSRVGA